MRIRYTGDQPTDHGQCWASYGGVERQATGLWAPGEVREVPDDVAAALVAGGGWEAVDGVVAGPATVRVGRSAPETVTPNKARKGQEE